MKLANSRSSVIFSEVLVYASGGAAQRAGLLLLVPMLGWVLSEADFGRWTIFVALLPMATAILDSGYSKAVGRFYFDYDETSEVLAAFLGRAIWLRLAMFAVLIPAVLTGLWLSWPMLTGGKLPAGCYVAYLTVACTSEAVILGVTAFSRARHITAIFGIIRVGQGVLTVLLCFALGRVYGLDGAVLGLVLANLIVATIALGWVIFWLSRQPRLEAAPKRFSGAAKMVRYGAPLVVHDLSWWVRNSSTLIILSHFADPEMVGAYSIGFVGLSFVAMLTWSIDFALAPYYYRWRSRDLQWQLNTEDSLSVVSGIILIVAITGILFFENTRFVVFGDKFSEADDIAPILLTAAVFQPLYFMIVKPYFFLRKTFLLSCITFTMSSIVVAGTVLAAYVFGHIGAASMTLVSFGGIVIVGYLFSTGLEEPPFKLSEGLRPALVCSALALLTYTFEIPVVLRIAAAALVAGLTFKFQILKPLRALQERQAFEK